MAAAASRVDSSRLQNIFATEDLVGLVEGFLRLEEVVKLPEVSRAFSGLDEFKLNRRVRYFERLMEKYPPPIQRIFAAAVGHPCSRIRCSDQEYMGVNTRDMSRPIGLFKNRLEQRGLCLYIEGITVSTRQIRGFYYLHQRYPSLSEPQWVAGAHCNWSFVALMSDAYFQAAKEAGVYSDDILRIDNVVGLDKRNLAAIERIINGNDPLFRLTAPPIDTKPKGPQKRCRCIVS